MNEPSTQATPPQGSNPVLDFLHKVRASQTDRILGGVCAASANTRLCLRGPGGRGF